MLLASRNNSRKKKTDLKTLIEVIFIIIDAATLGTIFVFIGHDAGGPQECTAVKTGTLPLCLTTADNNGLGTWKNMPSATTELMGNTSYRAVLMVRTSGGSVGLSAGLEVGCITPSNTVGAQLQLQYANYSDTTHTNSSNFANLGMTVFIDNSANWPCPGTLENNVGTLPAINLNPVGYLFRVLGMNGGGSGDNPRFSLVSVYVTQSIIRTFIFGHLTPGTSSFLGFIQSNFPVTASTTPSFDWFATNASNTVPTCGTGDLCEQHGTNSCTIAIAGSQCTVTTTYGTAFTGTVVVQMTGKQLGTIVSLSIGTIGLLQAQTLTV